ncbi:MAG TPA: hypothetical protein VFS67_34670 [Polyangiaceae bacterium]|jgi:hypothetical protein|nr:hypothetical protein [Polyangiaceae bacterium]
MNQKALLAAAVSGILLGGSVGALAEDAPKDSKEKAGAGAKHACKGQNGCKGQGGCKTDKHSCKGQNACKGQGGCKG